MKKKEAREIVRRAYLRYLNREPDKNGWQSYTNALVRGRMDKEGLKKSLRSSKEYKHKHKGDEGVEDWIEDNESLDIEKKNIVLLNKNASDIGLNYCWMNPPIYEEFEDVDMVIYSCEDCDEYDDFVIACGQKGIPIISNHEFSYMVRCDNLSSPIQLKKSMEKLLKRRNFESLMKSHYNAYEFKSLKNILEERFRKFCQDRRIMAVIPVHEREPLLKYTIKNLRNQTFPLDEIICIGDKESERELCENNGAVFVYYRNKPLGAKWQFGIDVARNLGATDILYVGSSDWVSSNWCETFLPYMYMGYDLLGCVGSNMVDVGKNELRFGVYEGYINPKDSRRGGEPMGAGRIITKNMLDKLEWELFDYEIDSSLDWSMYSRIQKNEGEVFKLDITDIHDCQITKIAIECFRWENKHSLSLGLNRGKAEIVKDIEGWFEEWFPLFFEFVKELRRCK